MASPAARRHRVVIIGSGFGGLTAAKVQKRADVDVTLIAKTTSHLVLDDLKTAFDALNTSSTRRTTAWGADEAEA